MFSRVPPSPKAPRTAAAALALTVLVVAIGIGGCRCLRGPINASPGLRWWLFSNFGAQQICPEMLKRGMGLRMQDRGNMVGRFFPSGCTVEVNGDQNTVTLHFSGTGYAYTPVTRRVGFEASGSVEYRPDFYMGEDDIYVWGKLNRIVNGPHFNLQYVENPLADAATAVTPLGTIANLFGNQIVTGELTRGFTVLENWDTETKTFALGIINPPMKPHTPYDVSKDEHYTFANESVEVQWNQRDFMGPFEVLDSDQQLQVRMMLQGPAVDILVVHKQVGDIWRDSYQQGHPLGPPPGPVLGGVALQPGPELRNAFRVPPGQYYIVIDHTQYAGTVMPPAGNPLNPLGGPAAVVTYTVQLGER